MAKSPWEPKVPSADVVRNQVKNRPNKIAGSIRLALGKVVGSERIVNTDTK